MNELPSLTVGAVQFKCLPVWNRDDPIMNAYFCLRRFKYVDVMKSLTPEECPGPEERDCFDRYSEYVLVYAKGDLSQLECGPDWRPPFSVGRGIRLLAGIRIVPAKSGPLIFEGSMEFGDHPLTIPSSFPGTGEDVKRDETAEFSRLVGLRCHVRGHGRVRVGRLAFRGAVRRAQQMKVKWLFSPTNLTLMNNMLKDGFPWVPFRPGGPFMYHNLPSEPLAADLRQVRDEHLPIFVPDKVQVAGVG